jgi:hypothetical protein
MREFLSVELSLLSVKLMLIMKEIERREVGVVLQLNQNGQTFQVMTESCREF